MNDRDLAERTIDPISDIKPGLPVYTLDNEQLGEVKEVTDDRVKIDAPMQPDYWLLRRDVLSFSAERVTVNFNKDQLGDFKTDGPDKR